MASIQFGGVITGIDTKESADRRFGHSRKAVIKLLENQKIILQAKDAMLPALAGDLGALDPRRKVFRSPSTLANARPIISSDATVLTASAEIFQLRWDRISSLWTHWPNRKPCARR